LERLITGLGIAGITGLLKFDVPKANAAAGDYLKLGTDNDAGNQDTSISSTNNVTLIVREDQPSSSLYSIPPAAIYASSSTGSGVWGLVRGSAGSDSASDRCAGVRGEFGGSGLGYGLFGFSGSLKGYALGTFGKSQFGDDILPTYDKKAQCGDSTHRWKEIHAEAIHIDTLYGPNVGSVFLRSAAAIKSRGDILPGTDNKWDLGDAQYKWSNVYANKLYGTVASTSLSKFKENIESPTDIDYLSAIPDPIYFNWKNSEDKKRHLGYVGDYLPDIAKQGDGYIYTNSVIAILCGAVQQLKDAVNQLKEENEQLRKKIKD